MLKNIGLGLVIVMLAGASIYFEQVRYGIIQLKGQLHIMSHAVPVEEYLSGHPDDSAAIRVIREARTFAVEELGLVSPQNYQTIYDQHGEPSMWVVSAVEPFAMEARKWSFPIVGSFNYKGYFDRWRAEELQKELQAAGYDTYLRTAGAWSTLGWFEDPILSNILDRDIGHLAELIIHELTHSTLFVKDSVNFNENLATFIGEEGAKKFLLKYYPDSLQHYERDLEDEKRFQQFMVEAYRQLEDLYQQLPESLDSTAKFHLKQAKVTEILNKMDSIPFNDQTRYAEIQKKIEPNNAYFYAFKRYFGDQNELERIFRHSFGSDVTSFIAEMKQKYKSIEK